MKILLENYFCPKCKREYQNRELMSFYDGMATQAENFIKTNKKITHCEKCGVRLVSSYYKEYFGDDGKFIKECENLKFDEKTIDDFVIAFLRVIYVFGGCFESTNFSVGYIVEVEEGKIEQKESESYILFSDEKKKIDTFEKVKLNGYYVLKGRVGECEYELLKARLHTTYNNVEGIRYNFLNFKYLLNRMECTLKFILEYVAKETIQITNSGWENEYDFYYDALRRCLFDINEIPREIIDSKI